MRLQDQVCTLEQAKQLEELGIMQGTSLFVFREGYANPSIGADERADNPQELFDAFTVAELGEMLPSDWSENWNHRYWPRRRGNLDWVAGDESPTTIETTKEVDARASLLIHMLKSFKVTPGEVNARLSQ